MKLRCIIIDDEPLAIKLMKSYVEKTPFLTLVATFENPLEAMKIVNSKDVDLLFLDINMPDINGLEFSKMLPPSLRIIFTTAYDQYAVESFRLNALDYLLKPINYADFLNASNRALEWFKLLDQRSMMDSDTIFIKSGYKVEKIALKDILYIENQKDYVKFHLEGVVDPISSLMSMQSLEEKLPQKQFMRIHRSFIVNLDNLKTIERNCIVFNKTYIPISESYKVKFAEFMDKHSL